MLMGKYHHKAEMHTQVSLTPNPFSCPPHHYHQRMLPPEVICNCSFMSSWEGEKGGRGRAGGKALNWTETKGLGMALGFTWYISERQQWFTLSYTKEFCFLKNNGTEAKQILNIQPYLSILFWFGFHGNLYLLGSSVCICWRQVIAFAQLRGGTV